MTSSEHSSKVIVYVDKTMVSISGIKVVGVNINELERLLFENIGANVRIIGVTTENIDMDLYGSVDYKLEDIAGKLLKVISVTDEITCNDIVEIYSNGRLIEVDYINIPQKDIEEGCVGERWLKFKKNCNNSDGR